MIEVHVVFDPVRGEQLVFAGERVGETLYAFEPHADGRVMAHKVQPNEPRKPLLLFSGGASRELLQALVTELAQHGFRAPDDRLGVVPALETALTDTKATRDRLLTLIEKVVK